MCGICGQYNFAERVPVQRADVARMAASIAHRGPDDEGYYLSGPVGLGFRRLSIIDLAGGHQPMSNQEESVWVVFNGEIYNYPELRRELEGFGHSFRTNSDTEVIVHGYKQWGDDVLNHLNGMFGLAIWDAHKERLVLARDRFGIKMIYYRADAGRLYFGSEIRAVRAGTRERGEVNPAALNLFLRYRYTPSPYTIFRGINKLPAGTMLVCEKKSIQVKRWYQYRPTPFAPPKSVAQVEDELLELYKQSMKRHLLSDVPVGLLLSGGIDSGMLLALMNLYGERWRTYTVGYGSGFADDELRDAAVTAAHFSAQHAEVKLDRAAFETALPSIVACLEEPIASSSIVPMYFVCQRAREDVKVALIGQGPDELFGGYRRHLGVRYGSWWGEMPAWMRHTAADAIRRLPRNEALKRATYSLDVGDRKRRYQQVLSLLPGNQIDALFCDGLLEPDAGDAILGSWADLMPLLEETDELGGFQFVEMRSTLPDELLMFADKLSMAHGLEARVPFLDKELVEYVERLPAQFKVRNGSRKWMHRRICAEFLPAEFLRRKKRGFGVNAPNAWFRGAIAGTMEETILDSESCMYRFLQPSAVQEMLRQHKAGKNDLHKILFSLALFEQWLRVQTESTGAVEQETVSSY